MYLMLGNFTMYKRQNTLYMGDGDNGLDQERPPRCFLCVHVQLMREVKSKQAWSHHKEGACGEQDTPLLFPPRVPSRCHRASWMMEHSHSELRERWRWESARDPVL